MKEHFARLKSYGIVGSIRFWYDVWYIRRFANAVKKVKR